MLLKYNIPLALSLILVIISAANILAQSPNWEFSERVTTTSISDLEAHPEDFDHVEREEIFLWKANEFHPSNMDSVYIIYNQMIGFGKRHKDPYVEAAGYGALGEMQRIMGDFQQARYYFIKAVKLLDPYPSYKSIYLMALSQTYLMLNDLDSAEIIIDQCLEHTYAHHDSTNLSNPHIVKGEILAHREMYTSALDQYLKALEYSKYLLPLKKANIYRDIAVIYNLIGDGEKALEYMNRGLQIAVEHGYKRTESMFHVKIGARYRSTGEYNKSISHFTDALIYEEKNIIPNKLLKLYAQLVLTHLKLNNLHEAKTYFQKASTLEADVKNSRDKSIFFIASGYYHLEFLHFEDARINFQKVIEIGRQSSTPKRMINGYQGLIDVNKAQGHWEEAFSYRDSLGVAIVEMNVSNQIKHINDLESKYQAQLKQEEIKRLNIEKELQKQEIKKKNGVILFSIGGLLLSLLAIFGFYRANRIKTESNQLLTDKNTELESALVTNKMLVKEIHHRVKNNLQVVSSLLNLQSRFEKEESILDAINSGKNRVQTMSLLHQNLYGNEDLKMIKVQKYFRELAESLTDGYPLGGQKVELKTEIDDIEMDVEKVIPLGLIANELITNALKYAYVKSMENCELLLVLKQAGDEVELRVSDNGVGIPFDTIPSRPKSMGMQLIHSFSRKLKAKIRIDNQNGTDFILRFNVS